MCLWTEEEVSVTTNHCRLALFDCGANANINILNFFINSEVLLRITTFKPLILFFPSKFSHLNLRIISLNFIHLL